MDTTSKIYKRKWHGTKKDTGGVSNTELWEMWGDLCGLEREGVCVGVPKSSGGARYGGVESLGIAQTGPKRWK